MTIVSVTMKKIIPQFALSLLLFSSTFIGTLFLRTPIAITQTAIPEKEIRQKIKAVTVQINGKKEICKIWDLTYLCLT